MKKTKFTALSLLLTLAVAMSIFVPLQVFGDNGSTKITMAAGNNELRAEILGEHAKYDEVYLHSDNLVNVTAKGSVLSPGDKVLGKINIVNSSGNEYTVEEVIIGSVDASGMKRVYTEGAQNSRVKPPQAQVMDGAEWYDINYKYYSKNEGLSDDKILEYLYGGEGQDYQPISASGGYVQESSATMIAQAKSWLYKKGFLLSFDLDKYPVNEKATAITPGMSLQDYIDKSANSQKVFEKVLSGSVASGTTSFDYGFAVHQDNCNNTFYGVDVKVPITIKLKKVQKEDPAAKITVENLNEMGLPLKDSTFKLTALDGGSIAPKAELVTGEDGKLEFTLDKEKNYKLEITPPKGYNPIGEIAFGVNKAGEITDLNGAGKTFAAVPGVQKSVLQITNSATPQPPTPVTTVVTVQNVDQSLTNLPGAKLLVTAVDGGTVAPAAVQTVGMDGTAAFTLEAGKNYNLQVTSPNGYNAVGAITFLVDENGEIASVDGSGKSAASVAIFNKKLLKITHTLVPPNTKKVTIQNFESGNNPVTNTTMAVTALNGGIVNPGGTVILAGESKTQFTLEAEKTYKLEVTSPKGYNPIGEITFTVDTNGNITALSGAGAAFAKLDSADNSILNIVHTKTPPKTAKITVENLDEIKGPLQSGSLQVSALDGGSVLPQTKVDLSNTNKAEFTLEVNKNYKLTVTAPQGYEAVGEVVFGVNESGNIVNLNTGGKGAVKVSDTSGSELQIHNTKIKPKTANITVQKVDEAGNPLAGAGFTLAGPSNQSFSQQVTTAGGELSYTLEVSKNYTLKQTKTPSGYETVGDITFTVNENGEVTALGGTGKDNAIVKGDKKQILQITGVKIVQQTTPETVKVTVAVVNAQKKAINGVGIMVFSLDGGQIDLGGEQKVNASGKIAYTLEKNKKYELVGSTIPEGCDRISNIIFRVNEEGEVVILSGEAQVASGDRSVLTIVRNAKSTGTSGTNDSTGNSENKNEKTDKNSNSKSNAKETKGTATGDSTPILLVSLLLCMSAVVGGFALKKRRQK